MMVSFSLVLLLFIENSVKLSCWMKGMWIGNFMVLVLFSCYEWY